MLIQPACCESVLGNDDIPLCAESSGRHLLIESKGLRDDVIHPLLQRVAEFDQLLSGGFLLCIYEVGRHATDLEFGVRINDVYLGPVSFCFLLVQDVHVLLLVAQEAFDVDEGVGYNLHGCFLVQLNGDWLVVLILLVIDI